ncbi:MULTISPECIES: hypothetical protein [Rhodococcus]|jgi:hypothetical protein|uniref:hypothetical protein n=1 Tax=Rhodococcus TaxID=1827 RepID=UPI0002B7C346|nr:MULTISPECIES: hypothetical protein [Rhodococcus]ARE32799.1 hypothetical protein A0W34_05210 [Rhodococcus sp. BH4]EME17051.1 hypothetical protein G418_24816 [Rhodococcus qingshengii BKS 20-40]MBT2272002.1 hypothetical protein [Rhodococcus qingshengii]QTS01441.1 hypothetical protein J6K27_001040 [Rhodococcus qingshengii]QXC44002.1 hypothetical protein KSE96_05315 [Rhodococcus qingshengii]
MRALIVILMVLGFVVGGIPLVGIAIDMLTSRDDTIVYQGAYEPIRGVQMSRDYESSLDISYMALPDKSPEWLILACYPLIGAALGALTAAVLGRLGWRLTRA